MQARAVDGGVGGDELQLSAALVADFVKRGTEALDQISVECPGDLWWSPSRSCYWLTAEDSDQTEAWCKSASAEVLGGSHPPDSGDWIPIKPAIPLAAALKAATGLPLVNAVAGSLLGGALGYGGGRLLSSVLPESGFDRKRLATTMMLAGAGLGAMPGVLQGAANWRNSAQAGQPLGWSSFVTPAGSVPLSQGVKDAVKPRPLPPLPVEGLEKVGNLGAFRAVPVDAFNQAVWLDVARGYSNPFGTRSAYGSADQPLHTPPREAAQATSLMSGVSALFGDRSILAPQHLAAGFMAAGADAARATFAANTLGLLAGMTPKARDAAQHAGLWYGLLRGALSSLSE